MGEEKLLNIREVSLILGISEKEVIGLAENGQMPAYKVGGVYLRFKREQIEEFKKQYRAPVHKIIASQKYSFKERVSDFFYFNDFYILSALIMLLILLVIFRGY
jgi:excisionase family DNA binding protein